MRKKKNSLAHPPQGHGPHNAPNTDTATPPVSGPPSYADTERKFAQALVSEHLCTLTANFLRIVRGAGSVNVVWFQLEKLLDALLTYQNAHGHYPPGDELADFLSVTDSRADTSQITGEERERTEAMEAMIDGALQVAASRLLRQRTQETLGEREFYQGFKQLERLRAKQRGQS